MKMKTPIEEIKEKLEKTFQSSIDIEYQNLQNGSFELDILYIKSLCDENKLNKSLFKPFFTCKEKFEFGMHLRSEPAVTPFNTEEQAVASILRGNAILFLSTDIYLFDANKVVNGTLLEPSTETTLQGPRYSMSEDLNTSLNLIRNRYPSTQLQVEQTSVGSTSKAKVYIVYDQSLVNPSVLEGVKKDLHQVNTDIVQAAGQLHNLLTQKKRTLFPKLIITERPDRVVINLAQGKVILLLEGTPFALVAPAVFYDFFVAMDDLYQTYWVSRFLVLLRYFGLFISIIIPAFYIAITSFNPEILRVQLTVSIAGSRAAVPYPSYLEVIFMLGMMELLTEASIRLPKYIGSTATTVGGLILGQAAQQAGLVSTIMIIVTAAVAIANFVIPINAMSFAIRVTKYILVLLTTLFGTIGLLVGFLGIIIHLADMRCYGQPFLKFFPKEKTVSDGTKQGA
jgi:hypothetical protein